MRANFPHLSQGNVCLVSVGLPGGVFGLLQAEGSKNVVGPARVHTSVC